MPTPPRLMLAAVAVALIVGACSQPEVDDAVFEAIPENGVPAQIIQVAPDPTPVATSTATPGVASEAPDGDATQQGGGGSGGGTTDGSGDGGDGDGGGDGEGGGSSSDGPAVRREPVELVSASDPARDHGIEGPRYADIRDTTLVDRDTVTLDLTVTVNDPLPTVGTDDEQLFVIVDLTAGAEETYTITATFNIDGWLAYFQLPSGEFILYPGEFSIRGADIVFEVPWGAIGSPTRGSTSVQVDWNNNRSTLGLAINATSEDVLSGAPVAFDRNP